MKNHALAVVVLAARVASAQSQLAGPSDGLPGRDDGPAMSSVALTGVETVTIGIAAAETTNVPAPALVMTFVVGGETEEQTKEKKRQDGWWLLLLGLPVVVWRRRG